MRIFSQQGIVLAATVGIVFSCATASDGPVELGQIHWKRGYEAARTAAKESGLPLLVLFQEIPGCSTCVGYGNNVLSHPLLVEAAETLFTPVAIYNNIDGDDKVTLTSFKEPAWNNPVVRIVDADGKPLAPRVADDYTTEGLATAMVAALKSAGRPIPAYLANFANETASLRGNVETATFAMHCFWEGEGKLGALDGVLTTTAGFLDSMEVVEVRYDPAKLPYERLLEQARKMQCASRVFARTDAQTRVATTAGADVKRTDDAIRPDKEPKYYLSRTPWRAVPMTPTQACRVNAAIGAGASPEEYLSPRQIELGALAAKHPKANWANAINATDLSKAWQAAIATRASVDPK